MTLLATLLSVFTNASFIEQVPLPTESIETVQAVVVHVVDGDTIVVSIEGVEERVRYIGIDTPEFGREKSSAECYAQEATDKNKELVAGTVVTLVPDAENRDKYRRLLRYVYVDDVFVNAVLLTEGYAETLSIKPNVKHAKEFLQLKKNASQNKKGMWEACK